MNENDTIVAPLPAKELKKALKKAKPSNPYRIIPEKDRPGRWVVEMTYLYNGEKSLIFCGSFAKPEDAQKTWDMDEPTNRAELVAEGYDIKVAKKPKPPAEPKFLVQSKTEKDKQGRPQFWSQDLKAFGSKNKATAHTKRSIKGLSLPEGHEIEVIPKKKK